jgi:DNA recombination protein RmuC
VNPDWLPPLAAGTALGAALAWLFLRARLAEARLRAEHGTEGREEARARASELAVALEEATAQSDALREEIRQADVARAIAQQTAARLPALQEELSLREATLREAQERLQAAAGRLAGLEATLREERKSGQERETRLAEAFKALSTEALHDNHAAFLDLARPAFEKLEQAARADLERRAAAVGGLLEPVRDTFARFEERVQALEAARAGAYASLTQQVGALRAEAARLAQALGAPAARGRWGELQLRRSLELAGLLERCDFVVQPTAEGEARLRPDVIVRLPGGGAVILDAKAPLTAYLEAMETEDPARRTAALAEHARRLREHARALGRKAYWEGFASAADFVVLFLPGEAFFAAALSADAELLDWAAARGVILASPTTLIALLRAVALAWRQDQLHAHAREIAALARRFGSELDAARTSLEEVGRRLDQAQDAWRLTRRHWEDSAGRAAEALARLGLEGTPSPEAER